MKHDAILEGERESERESEIARARERERERERRKRQRVNSKLCVTFDLRKEAILFMMPGTALSSLAAGFSWRIRTMGTASGTRWISLSSSEMVTGPFKRDHQFIIDKNSVEDSFSGCYFWQECYVLNIRTQIFI